MTPLDIILKLLGFAAERIEKHSEAHEALMKACFELEKRKEIEDFNHTELIKLRAELKHAESRITNLTLENNILKKQIMQED